MGRLPSLLLCVAALATASSTRLLRHTEPTPMHIGATVHRILKTVNMVQGAYVERLDDIADRHNASVEDILNKAVAPPTLVDVLRANKGEIGVPAAKEAGPQAGPQAATAGQSGAFDKTAAEIEEKIKAAHLPGGSLAAGAAKKAKKKAIKKQALAAAGT